MTLFSTTAAPAPGPGDAALYDTAVALAVTTEHLADAIDDNRPGWLDLATAASDLLDKLVTAKLDADTGFDAVIADIYARAAAPENDTAAALFEVAADLSATAGDLAGAIADGRTCPGHLTRARRLLGTLTEAIEGIPASPDPDISLPEIARRLDAALHANRRPAITDANQLDVQALMVAEEAGELVGAYRRWAGKARRTGTMRELEDEVADVLITTAVFARRTGIDLIAAVARKVSVIYTRGWREEDTPDGAA
jgi:NTP pyrophosphatase (non-canonical NTP hydrolase)